MTCSLFVIPHDLVAVYNVTFPSIATLVVYKLCFHLINTYRRAVQESVDHDRVQKLLVHDVFTFRNST